MRVSLPLIGKPGRRDLPSGPLERPLDERRISFGLRPPAVASGDGMAASAWRGDVRLRRFPAPYRAMLAISSDIDRTSIHGLRATHRFINSTEDTPIGPGLGLDFANSMWMYGSARDDAHYGRVARAEVAYWKGRTGDVAQTPFADELVAYAHAGWIDTLHSYGNFSQRIPAREPFTRELARIAIDELARRDVFLQLWTNHGARTNAQNIGRRTFAEGDRRKTPAYHADLLHDYGLRFLAAGKMRPDIGYRLPIVRHRLTGGRFVHMWQRFTSIRGDEDVAAAAASIQAGYVWRDRQGAPVTTVWTASLLHQQIKPSILDYAITHNLFVILGQHLGNQGPLPGFDRPAADALRRLKSHQDSGRILVARTSRLLRYAATLDALTWRVVQGADGPVVDILSLNDKVEGVRTPRLEDLRGITFEVRNGARAAIAIAGRSLAGNDVTRTSDGENGTVGVAWHTVDTTDWTREFTRRNPMTTVSGGPIRPEDKARLGALNGKAVDWLNEVGQTTYAGASPKQAYAHRYAVGRHRVGMERYGELLSEIGFTGRGPGLDVGSGAGHWVNAYAVLNERADGVDSSPEFVALANGISAAIGLSDQTSHAVADAVDLPFADASYDSVWSHGVMMFTRHDKMFFEMNRVLRRGGFLYLAYSTLGLRFLALSREGDTEQDRTIRRNAVDTIYNAGLFALGVRNTLGGRTRAYNREQLQQSARYAGFDVLGAPGLQDAARKWGDMETTIDLVAVKQADVDARLAAIVGAAEDDAGLVREIDAATVRGAPEAALKLIEIAGLDAQRDDIARARLRAGVMSGGIASARHKDVAALSSDRSEAARLLEAMCAVNFAKWRSALSTLAKLPRTRDALYLQTAALFGRRDVARALAAAEDLAAVAPTDAFAQAALLKALEAAGESARLADETSRLLAAVQAGGMRADLTA